MTGKRVRSPASQAFTGLQALLPMLNRRITYLDTNAVSDLSRWRERAAYIEGLEQVRRDLCSFASRRAIALGQWVFSEMAGFESGEGRTDFLADLAFVEQLQFLRVFRSSGEMMRREVQAFLKGYQVDPVMGTRLPQQPSRIRRSGRRNAGNWQS